LSEILLIEVKNFVKNTYVTLSSKTTQYHRNTQLHYFNGLKSNGRNLGNKEYHSLAAIHTCELSVAALLYRPIWFR
jgi:hypothetical protein